MNGMKLIDKSSGYFVLENETIDKWLRVLGPGPFSLYCLFKRFCRGNKEQTFPLVTQQDWAEYMGVSFNSFKTYLRVLKDHGLIEVKQPTGMNRINLKPSLYILHKLSSIKLSKKQFPKPFTEQCRFTDPIYEDSSKMFRIAAQDQYLNSPTSPNNGLTYQPKIWADVNNNTVNNNTVKKLNKKARTKKAKNKQDSYSRLTKRLRTLIPKRMGTKVPKNANFGVWTQQFRLLHQTDGVPLARINQVMDWYEDNAGYEYTPVAVTGGSFRKKFSQLEIHMNKDGNSKPRSRQGGAAVQKGKYKGKEITV